MDLSELREWVDSAATEYEISVELEAALLTALEDAEKWRMDGGEFEALVESLEAEAQRYQEALREYWRIYAGCPCGAYREDGELRREHQEDCAVREALEGK